jgi:hypothetical protein
MLQPTYKVYKAEFTSNACVSYELESGKEITSIEPTKHSKTPDGYIITKWSHLGELQTAHAYAADPDADPEGEYPWPVIDLGFLSALDPRPRFDSSGVLITIDQVLTPHKREGTEDGSDNTDVIPWAIRALNPSRPNIMPAGWQQMQSDVPTEHLPIPDDSLPDSDSSPPGSALSSAILLNPTLASIKHLASVSFT